MCQILVTRKLYKLDNALKQRDEFKQYDKQVDGGFCGRERPDFAWETPTHVVILEVDEDQHKHIARECEDVRMKNVTSSYGMPVYWIRYNPDHFNDVWPQLTDTVRQQMLVDVIRESLSAKPDNTSEYCRVKYLFYDGLFRGCAFPLKTLAIL